MLMFIHGFVKALLYQSMGVTAAQGQSGPWLTNRTSIGRAIVEDRL